MSLINKNREAQESFENLSGSVTTLKEEVNDKVEEETGKPVKEKINDMPPFTELGLEPWDKNLTVDYLKEHLKNKNSFEGGRLNKGIKI